MLVHMDQLRDFLVVGQFGHERRRAEMPHKLGLHQGGAVPAQVLQDHAEANVFRNQAEQFLSRTGGEAPGRVPPKSQQGTTYRQGRPPRFGETSQQH